jgi:predicted nucleotidyltransferase
MFAYHMKLHHPLDQLLASPGRVRVLRVLVRQVDRGWTGREMAAAARVSAPQTIASLKALETAGLVERKTVGRAHEWRLVSECALATPLKTLFKSEGEIPALLEDELTRVLRELGVRRAILFGSVGRGDETERSDIDLYCEVDSDRKRGALQAALTPTFVRIFNRYGLSLSPYILTTNERAHPVNPQLLANVEREGRVLLKG